MTGSDPQARLLAVDPEVAPPDVELTESCTIGRAPSCHVVVPRPIVSRLHAIVEPAGPRWALRDAGSANGTFVNGVRLTAPHLLADRDALGFGDPTAVLRFHDPDPTVAAGARLRYDEPSMRFSVGDRPLDLTPSEFRLLRHLHARIGAVCSREACAEAVWGLDYAPGLDADALDRLLSNLRGKLRRHDPAELIQTRPGLGYVLRP